jgi:cysteine desulfurase
MSTNSKSKLCSKVIYFDNNSTTLMCKPALQNFTKWLSCYNPSSDSKIAKPSKKLLEMAIDDLLNRCGTSTATHRVIFTSGASESNCLIIKSCVRAYKKKLIEKNRDTKPHIIASAMEHHSIMDCLYHLEKDGDIEVSYVEPRIFGNIIASDVEKLIRDNTCLITVMYANNEIPIINNVELIGDMAHKYKIPLHSDCVQIFGKYKIDMKAE